MRGCVIESCTDEPTLTARVQMYKKQYISMLWDLVLFYSVFTLALVCD